MIVSRVAMCKIIINAPTLQNQALVWMYFSLKWSLFTVQKKLFLRYNLARLHIGLFWMSGLDSCTSPNMWSGIMLRMWCFQAVGFSFCIAWSNQSDANAFRTWRIMWVLEWKKTRRKLPLCQNQWACWRSSTLLISARHCSLPLTARSPCISTSQIPKKSLC